MNIPTEKNKPERKSRIPASVIYKGSQNNKINLTDFFKTRFFKFIALSFLVCLGSWIFLNIFITPINRLFGLPPVDNLENYSPISSIEVYDKDDQFVTALQGAEDRQVIPLSQITTSLRQALFASEDREFFQHNGINFMGILRAMLINLKSGKLKQGGSTITQQLVKNIFFSPKDWKSSQRKFKEAFLTIEVEKRYSKEQILEIYLNQIYWGKGAYGAERAAKRYFNKSASQLNIAESAYLVALLPSPSTLHNTKESFLLQKNIINNMSRYGYITAFQAKEALNYSLKFESAPGNLSKYPYYMSVVLEELRSRFSEEELRHKGLKVYTAIDPIAQAKGEEILTNGIRKAPSGISQGALVTIDVQSNEVRAIVGGIGDFWKFQWNRATSKHMIGSAFKPFVYLTAFIKGLYSSNSMIMDSPYTYENQETGEVWSPKNFDSSFWGEITVRKALVNSRNIPALRVAQKTTMESIIETAEKVGIKGVEPYLSSALGSSAISPLKAANAYAVLARGGLYMEPIIIRRIVDRSGKNIEQNNPNPERVLQAGPIHELIDILVDVVDHGTATQAKIPGIQVAGKTGTTDGSRDVWFIGFTPDTVTVLWGGNDKNRKSSSSATGGGVMAAIWREFMKAYYIINPMTVSYFPKPSRRIRLLIDPITGLLATADSFKPEYREFVPGTEPKRYAPPPTMEQIENFTNEQEEQRRNLEEDSGEEDLENPEDMIEEQLTNNSNSSFPQPKEINNNPDNLPPPPIRQNPIINREENQAVIPPSPQTENQLPNNNAAPADNSENNNSPEPRRRLFRRQREEQNNQNAETNGQNPEAPPQRSRWKRLFSSPY